MFRLWCKIFENTHLIKDTVIENNNPALSRTAKILDGLESACYEFNLGKPMWLDSNIKTFQKYSKVRFTQDNFVESIDFDYLEIQVIEED